MELSDEVQDSNNPNTSTFFLKRTVKLFDEDMVVQLSYEGMVLKMITAEPAELFNKRNMIKMTGGNMDEQMISSAFNRLKTSLKNVMNKEGESIEEDNVHYYLYEREEFGIMVVNDTNIDRVSLVIAY
ncbi:hypothetical protein [Butyrivibrio sp. LC3010]|uniref:hypothetical protein n=1 Tax=Butyrivibrio sp. LC3010 TaxID=1280680 RepID=UPI00047E2B74|nr:hypothetical protein [Butyrivibrio sp. LC3010]